MNEKCESIKEVNHDLLLRENLEILRKLEKKFRKTTCRIFTYGMNVAYVSPAPRPNYAATAFKMQGN